MDSFTLKKSFIWVMLLLLCGMTLKAANNPQVVVKLDKPGSLISKVSFYTTNLKVIGSLDGKDMYYLRKMAGCDNDGRPTKGELATLDLSEANILTGNYIYLSMSGEFYFNGLQSVNLVHDEKDAICQFEFSNCNALKKIILPSSLKSIRRYAFQDCTNLRSCEIPSALKEIGVAAFADCALNKITIPSTVTKIGAAAFENCDKLLSIELPSGLLEIESETFKGCKFLGKIVLPSQLVKIGDWAFSQCGCLLHVEFPNTLQEIGDGAFYNNCLLQVDLPPNLVRIDDYAFESGTFRELKLPKSLTYIGRSAFGSCEELSSVYVFWNQIPNLDVAYAFDEVPMEQCTLYVPKGKVAQYKSSSNWSYFKNIVEFDATGIDKVVTSTDVKEVSRYSVNGQRLSAPTKGLNIVKYSDGSVKKVAIQ